MSFHLRLIATVDQATWQRFYYNQTGITGPCCHLSPLSPFVPSSWPDLHQWSVTEVDQFWQAVADFCDIKWLKRGEGHAYTPPPGGHGMRHARWFDGAKINFAHNLLPSPTDEQVLPMHGMILEHTNTQKMQHFTYLVWLGAA